MSIKRLNSSGRLAGGARRIGIAQMSDCYRLCFPVWSRRNGCAAASIRPAPDGRRIVGMLYEIPSSLVYREEADALGQNSLDAIEGEGVSYVRREIEVCQPDGTAVSALTYVAREAGPDLKTGSDYVGHILAGLAENDMPHAYRTYVRSCIAHSNPELSGMVDA